ncbi:MAG TPA: DUF6159 family protein [Clostridia bacterium]|nr:DUF6159 family protein [Clostridia bacterium]
MNKFQNSWQLFKSSIAVMAREKKLLLFPVLTTLCTIVIGALFLAPVAFQSSGHSYTSGQHWQAVADRVFDANTITVAQDSGSRTITTKGAGTIKDQALLYFALLYFTSMFVATFFNVAFYSQILRALRGEPVSIAAGLAFACTRWQTILAWTLFAGLVGYLIAALEERFGVFGALVIRLLGTAWSIACIFVIPVIITGEKTFNPLTVLKESALTLRQTWGESLIGYAGVGFGNMLVLFVSLVWLGGGISVAVALHLYWVAMLIFGVWLLAILLWSYLLSVASQIFRCALFLFAVDGTLPAPYTREMMALAWKQKKVI